MAKYPLNSNRSQQNHHVNGWTDNMDDHLSYKLNHLQHAETKKGKLVTFFKNGDPHFKGLKTSVSKRQFHTFDTLLAWLSEKIPTTTGIRYIYLLPDRDEITDVSQFVNGRSYLVSSKKKIERETYGDSKEKYWSNRPPTAGRFRKGETVKLLENGQIRKTRSFPSSRTGSLKHYPDHAKSEATISSLGLAMDSNVKPKVLTIISNTHRDSSEKFILNPKTTQTYEEVLSDISDMLTLRYPPASSLWTSRKPYTKVKGFSHMFRGLKHHSSFLAVGQELEPFEVSSDNVHNGDLHNGYEDELLPPPPKQKPLKQQEPAYQKQPARQRKAPLQRYPHVNEPRNDRYDNQITTPPVRPAHEYILRKQNSRSRERYKGFSRYQPQLLNNRVDEGTQVEYADLNEDYTEGREATPVTPPPAPRLKPKPIKHIPNESGDAESPYDRDLESQDAARSAKHMPYYKPYEERESVKVNIHGFPRTFYAPRYGQHEPDGSKPKKKLRLDWVYGYRGRDSRNNLLILPTDELVYFVSAVAVVYDIRRDQQRHYTEHNEDITCIALHPDRAKPKVATGQMAGHTMEEAAHVRVWDPITLVTYAVVGVDIFSKSVSSVGFSTRTGSLEQGALLMAVDEGEKHMMSIWNWQVDRLVAKTTTSSDTVVWGQFHPQDHTTLVTFGKNHVFFWKLFWDPESQNEGKILRDKKSGLFEGDYMPKFVTSMTFSSSGDVITGDSNGRVVVWQSDHEEAFVYNATLSLPMKNAHQKSVFVLCMLDDGTLLSGGGHDLKCWDSLNGYRFIREKEVSTDYGFIRTVVPVQSNHAYNQLYVGTTENCILNGTLRDHFNPVIQGPYEECWSLATHPDDYTFVTAGVDQQVRKWDSLNRQLVWQTGVEKPCLSLDLDPTGIVIALGTTVGRFIVLSNIDGMHVFSQQVGKAQLGVIKFSPEGDFIAIGSHDSSIYIFEVEDEGRVFRRHASGVLTGHKNFVTHIDWARNGKFLRSVSGDYDLLFWSVAEMREVSAKSMRDEIWYTENCVLSYNHLGSWSNLTEGGDINTVDLAHRKDILAVGENMGSVKLYKFPCTAERPHFIEQKKYSGHVTKVAFTFDDNFLLTTGGRDAGILQYAIIKTSQL